MEPKILIRAVNWLGDSVLTLPAVSALARAYPEEGLTVLCPQWLAPFWRLFPQVDDVVGFRSPNDALRRAVRMRREKFELALVFPNSVNSALCAWLSGARRRVGLDRGGRGFLLTDPIPVFSEDLAFHQVYTYLKLLGALGLEPERIDPCPHLSAPFRAGRAFRERLAGRPAIGINTGAGQGGARLWLRDRFISLARELREAFPGYEIAFFGTSREKADVRVIAAALDFPVIDLAGATTLPDFISALSCLSLFITNDNGSMHTACALGIPVVALFGPSDPATTGPFSDRAIVVRKDVDCAPCIKKDCPTDHRCMKVVGVSDVLRAVNTLMNGASPARAASTR